MKKLIFTAALFLGLATMGFAQQEGEKRVKKTPEEQAQLMTANLTEKLSLTEDQKTKVYAINLERAKKMEGFKGKDMKDKREAMKSFREDDSQLVAVLTDTQKKTYGEMKAKRAEKMKEMRAQGGHGGKGKTPKAEK